VFLKFNQTASKGRISAIGAIIGFIFVTVSLFQGNVNSDVFHAWVTQDLLPKLPEQAVIVMDNAVVGQTCSYT